MNRTGSVSGLDPGQDWIRDSNGIAYRYVSKKATKAREKEKNEEKSGF
jgi:hypothetical protein